ncbi:uncharacterized protein CDAR_540031 [Caerostris darwini]|uniref:Uncharacterized protein n=1 Tax=Caerostris darwini TaxID=1538125 RepID=A0AAV4TME0_9ARAC|nr:uncharacterized protein CDAR_540031 [Caerostris darwini]
MLKTTSITKLCFDITEDDSHQGFFPHNEVQGYWTFVEEKSPAAVLPHPRSGRRFFRLPQASTVIPYPRTGRMLVDPDALDYEFSFVPDYSWSSLDYPLTDNLIESKSISSKRGSIAFPPRVGRKKRSISDEESGNNDLSNSKSCKVCSPE